jgi:phytoene synthase
LQLANHWQDVSVDLAKDRIYLPQDEMSVHGLSDVDLFKLKETNAPLSSTEKGKRFQKFLAYKVQETQKLFEKGKPLPSLVRGRLRLELKLTWWGGVTVLQKIQVIQMDVFTRRPVLGKLDWFLLAFKSLIS